MSPHLVAWAPYDVKAEELGHSHFIGWQACRIWAELNISSWIQAQLKRKRKKEACFALLFIILFSNYYGRLLLQPIVYHPNAVRCKFSL